MAVGKGPGCDAALGRAASTADQDVGIKLLLRLLSLLPLVHGARRVSRLQCHLQCLVISKRSMGRLLVPSRQPARAATGGHRR